jgi:tetratricopeptide (TPR) repeat protein
MISNPAADLVARGDEAHSEKRLADARNLFAEAVDRCRRANDRLLLAQALSGLGQVERDMGNSVQALRHYRDVVALYRAQGNPLLLAHAVRYVGDLLREQGQPGKAEPFYAEALGIYRNHAQTQPLDLANTIRGCALLKADLGDPEEATFLWHEAMALYEEAGVPVGVTECQSELAFLMGQ